jgi:hypothetical protein
MKNMIDIDGHMIRPEDVSAVTSILQVTRRNYHEPDLIERITASFTIHLPTSSISIVRSRNTGPWDYNPLCDQLDKLRQKLLHAVEKNPRATAKAA